MPLTPTERRMRAQIGGLTLHSRYDSREITARARAGFDLKFEREADPKSELPPDERARRVERLRKAHFMRLALRSAQARRRRKAEAQID